MFFIRILREYERGVVFRLGRLLEPERPRRRLPDPDRRPDRQGRPAHDHAQHPAAGSDHQGQRARTRQRGRLLPDRRSQGGDRPGRELHGRDLADRADDAALGARPAHARRAARPSARRSTRSCQGIIDEQTAPWGIKVSIVEVKDVEIPAEHAARDGAAGRGRARAAREGDQRRGRVPGLRAAEGRGDRDRGAPDRAPAALPADAARARRVAVDDDRLPGADRPDQAVPRASPGAAPIAPPSSPNAQAA